MPSRRKHLSGPAAERRKKAGRGRGEGADYQPWIGVNDVPSTGTGAIIQSRKDGHSAHMLSQGESHCFYCFEWSERVIAIQEQYPMEVEDTKRIAASLGFRPPLEKGHDFVMTSDFRLLVQRGYEVVPVVRTFKRKRDLHGARLFEKLEIERIYHEERGIDWGIITDADIPPGLLQIADWVHDCYDIHSLEPLSEEKVRHVAQHLSRKIGKQPTVILGHLCAESDQVLQLPIGTSLKVVRFLIANKLWIVDTSEPIGTSNPVVIKPKDTARSGE